MDQQSDLFQIMHMESVYVLDHFYTTIKIWHIFIITAHKDFQGP